MFNSGDPTKSDQIITRFVLFFIWYRQNIHKFLFEPKIGWGELDGKIQMAGDFIRPSLVLVFGGLDAGYTFKRITAGINFTVIHGIQNSSAGI